MNSTFIKYKGKPLAAFRKLKHQHDHHLKFRPL